MSWEVLRDDPDNYQVRIECPSKYASKVEKTLSSHKIHETGAGGGKGWILGDGALILSGRKDEIQIVAQVLNDVIFGESL